MVGLNGQECTEKPRLLCSAAHLSKELIPSSKRTLKLLVPMQHLRSKNRNMQQNGTMLFTAAPLSSLLIITQEKPALMRGAALKFLSCVLTYLSRSDNRLPVRVSRGAPHSELQRDPVCRRLLPLQLLVLADHSCIQHRTSEDVFGTWHRPPCGREHSNWSP